jgi:hypothetical protein
MYQEGKNTDKLVNLKTIVKLGYNKLHGANNDWYGLGTFFKTFRRLN